MEAYLVQKGVNYAACEFIVTSGMNAVPFYVPACYIDRVSTSSDTSTRPATAWQRSTSPRLSAL